MARAIFEHYFGDFGDSPPPMICIDMDPGAPLTYGQARLSLFNTHVGNQCLMPFYREHTVQGKFGPERSEGGPQQVAAEVV